MEITSSELFPLDILLAKPTHIRQRFEVLSLFQFLKLEKNAKMLNLFSFDDSGYNSRDAWTMNKYFRMISLQITHELRIEFMLMFIRLMP